MQLWNDYEGRTIAEAYPLKKLVRPEGRSAFFLTTNGTGTPAMVRLIEAHFDEPEILARWQMVSGLKQENLVEMRKFGQTVLDGTPLVYAVMEPTEMSLADLLRNRTLTVEEAKQLAASLIAALTALHAKDLVHEHIDPSNILAAGETVKLRSDCVREAAGPDSSEAEVARRKAADAQALATVLLEAMTGRRVLQGSATLLPSPFDGIIRNGLSGKWGLSEMSAALGPVAVAKPAVPVAPAVPAVQAAEPSREQAKENVAPKTPEPAKEKPAPTLFDKVEPFETAKSASPLASATGTRPAASVTPQKPERPAVVTQAPDVRHRIVKPVDEGDSRKMKLWGIAAAVALVLLFFGWRFMRNDSAAGPANATSHPAAVAPSSAPMPAAPAKPRPAPEMRTNAPNKVVVPPAGAQRTYWRVVAYTYNHQDQAQQKVDAVKSQHPSLNPEVFSPTGRAPYLVTVGGPMTHDQAEAFRRTARSAGMPHDVYIQNFAR
ncbi:MAG TPA: hypothetical protein VL495_02915 [Edaphobacter sp.]|jgi:hypothetical protein|nr:hypothetical protein [Edaphobacter sp.]